MLGNPKGDQWSSLMELTSETVQAPGDLVRQEMGVGRLESHHRDRYRPGLIASRRSFYHSELVSLQTRVHATQRADDGEPACRRDSVPRVFLTCGDC